MLSLDYQYYHLELFVTQKNDSMGSSLKCPDNKKEWCPIKMCDFHKHDSKANNKIHVIYLSFSNLLASSNFFL